MKKFIFFVTGILLPVLYGFAQEATKITGKILSAETNKPLPGSTISLQLTHISTVSNDVGAYSIQLSRPSDSLIITRIGYRTQVLRVDKNTVYPLIIYLKKSTAKLHEIIVSTGYQHIPKERATGSFTFVNKELLNKQVGSTTDRGNKWYNGAS